MSQQPSTEVKCSDCGKATRVPFKPTAGRPVYCHECLPKHRTGHPNTGNRVEIGKQKPDTEKQAWSRRRVNWKN